jgi:hypothetical protein
MADLGELKIPVAMQPPAVAIIELTDEACAQMLDDEYATLAQHVVAKLARKRPSPLQSGRPATWAGAVIYALGQVNFLFDSSTKPYLTADDLANASGLSKSTLSARAKQIRDLLKMDWAAEYMRVDLVDDSPMTWFIQVDGLIVDARNLPLEIQLEACQIGAIPYIPALGREGTAAILSGQLALDVPSQPTPDSRS